jgi:hypothetical protein
MNELEKKVSSWKTTCSETVLFEFFEFGKSNVKGPIYLMFREEKKDSMKVMIYNKFQKQSANIS